MRLPVVDGSASFRVGPARPPSTTRPAAYARGVTVSGGRESWLALWLDQEGIETPRALDRALTSPRKRQELQVLAGEIDLVRPVPDTGARAPIAVGTGLDLSASMGGCLDAGCLKGDVDRLIKRTWHYFDRVMVVGPRAYSIHRSLEVDEEQGLQHVRGFAEMLFYIREVGAESLLSFADKRPACSMHLPDHAEQAGMGPLLADGDEWVERLKAGARCEVRFIGKSGACAEDHWGYTLNHDWLEHTRWGETHGSREMSPEEVIHEALMDWYRDGLGHLTADVEFARSTGAALGAGATLQEEVLESMPRSRASVLDVAFELPLPVLSGVSAKALMQLKEDHGAAFDVFRQALKTAIKERLKGDEPAAAAAIASEIAEDVIDPALADIGNAMAASGRLLRRSGALTAGVGVIATTVGLLAGAPMVVGPLVGAAVAGTDVKRYWADRKDVETSDMYFLWRLRREGHTGQ